ncbi:hypothetical protein BSKO_07504 [Bryopsis sp. KO-2023]|nr:hypothetical protein BSKO_07504 [Bryopsis sp. KO-2023]
MRWTLISDAGDAPAPRYGHSVVSLEARDDWAAEVVVLYGGTTKNASDKKVVYGDVAVFDVGREKWWKPEIKSNASPVARAFHSAVAIGSKMYMFGGHIAMLDQGGTHEKGTTVRAYFNDIWYLNLDTWEWREVAVDEDLRPPPRDLSQMTHIGGNRLLIFGGRGESGKALNDLWSFDILRKKWTHMQAVGPTPGVRMKHALAYVQGRVLLYGGETSSGSFYDDLWQLRVEMDRWQWRVIKTRPKPPGRSGHAVAGCGTYLLCFGGHVSASGFSGVFSRTHHYSSDLWLLDLTTGRWIKLKPQDEATPGERVCPTLLKVGASRLMLFGGRDKMNVFSDTWWLEMDPGDSQPPSPSARSISSFASGMLPTHASGVPRPRSQSNLMGEQATGFWASMVPNLYGSTPSAPPESEKSWEGSHGRIPRYKSSDSLRLDSETGATPIGAGSAQLQDLMSQFDLDIKRAPQDVTGTSPFCDAEIDSALATIGRPISIDNDGNPPESPDIFSQCVKAGRRILSRMPVSEFPVGNLWLLMSDYRRLASNYDVLKAWREGSPGDCLGRFVHMKHEEVRLRDVPVILGEYKRLLEIEL